MGCDSKENPSLDIADFYGEYVFEEIAYLPKSSMISDEQYQKDFKSITETFRDAEFVIKESYFYETSGVFGKNPSEGFEFITIKDYGEKYYDDLVREEVKNFEGLSTIFNYDNLKNELEVNEIEHYTMYVQDGVLSNPLFYVTKEDIFVAMETISNGETGEDLVGYTHYLLKLKLK